MRGDLLSGCQQCPRETHSGAYSNLRWITPVPFYHVSRNLILINSFSTFTPNCLVNRFSLVAFGKVFFYFVPHSFVHLERLATDKTLYSMVNNTIDIYLKLCYSVSVSIDYCSEAEDKALYMYFMVNNTNNLFLNLYFTLFQSQLNITKKQKTKHYVDGQQRKISVFEAVFCSVSVSNYYYPEAENRALCSWPTTQMMNTECMSTMCNKHIHKY